MTVLGVNDQQQPHTSQEFLPPLPHPPQRGREKGLLEPLSPQSCKVWAVSTVNTEGTI